MNTEWIGLFFVGLGTFFLLGEVLVNMRGIFALLGIGFITLYFYTFLFNPSSIALMIVIYFVGLLLIIIDGKLVNDGTLATIGLASMILAVALAAPNIFAGLYAVLGVILGVAFSFILLKFFKRRNMWQKIALKDRLTTEAGYSSLSKEYEALLGKEGLTVTDLRPVGTVRIDNNDYSAISNAEWINKGTRVIIVQVDGTRILVKRSEQNEN